MLRDEKGAVLKVVPVADDGSFHLADFERLITEKTKIVSVPHVSNVLGTVLPVKEIAAPAHAAGAVMTVDGAQGVVHMPLDVVDLDVDFYAPPATSSTPPRGSACFTARKRSGGDAPYQGGGDMIDRVTFEETTWADLLYKFEAGTPPIAQAIGLGAAIEYVQSIGMAAIARHEDNLLNYATQQLASVEGLRLIGTAPGKASVISFAMDVAHPHDISTIIDQQGVAIRAGHHCAQPLMDRYDLPSTCRASWPLQYQGRYRYAGREPW